LSTDALTPFSHVVLVLVGDGGAGPHDLVRMARQGRMYWDAADSQYYAEPKRLERLGYLTAEKRPGKTRERTHYMLTGKGRRAIAEWVREPVGFPRTQNEVVVRVIAGDLVGDDAAVLEGLEPLRADLADIRRRIEGGEEIAHTLPHRERYLLLAHGLTRRVLAAYEDWLEEVERELGPR
jgi:DNA-binding PadR family transcriptional regulator